MTKKQITHQSCIQGAQNSALFCILLAAVTLIGWTQGVDILNGLFHSMEGMKASAAIGFILCGFSLICLSSAETSRLFEWVGMGCAAMASIIGGLSLVEYFTGQDFSFERMLSLSVKLPERMTPLTAAGFFISGFILLFLNGRGPNENRIRQTATMLVFLLGMFAVIGYLYDVTEFYHTGNFTAISADAGFAFLLLVLGLILARPDSDPVALLINNSPTGQLVLRLLPVVILLPFLIGKLRLMGEQAGLYDPAFGVALNALATIFILTWFVWWNARTLLKAETSIKDSETRISAAIQTSLDGVVMVDEDGRVIEWSRQSEMIFGWSAEEAIGQKMVDLIIPEEYKNAHNRGMERYIETEESRILNQRVEVKALHRDGHTFPAELTIAAHKISGHYNFIGFIRDISERKANEELLRLAKEQAESANQAKSEFLASMSHEIRTPMNVVVGISNILTRDTIAPEKRREMLNTLKLSSQALLNLIDDVLDLAKIESQKIEMEYVSFRLDELITEIVDINQVKAKEKDITLEAEVSALENISFSGDPQRIRQIMMNLVSNAIKFTHRGRVMIYADSITGQNEDYTDIWLRIRDTGIGIAPDKLEKIFDKFTQADSSSTRQYGGSGLGLTISRELTELMGGSLTAKSEENKGSEFTLHLTLAKGDVNARPVKDKPRLRKIRPGVSLHVLIVESYEANIIVTAHLLNEIGHSFEVVKTGKDAIEKIKTENDQYDAVLMDLQLPDIDGIAAVKRIRQIEKKGNLDPIPVIGMTANASRQDKDRCLEAGMNDYLPKPFTLEQLKSVIDRTTN